MALPLCQVHHWPTRLVPVERAPRPLQLVILEHKLLLPAPRLDLEAQVVDQQAIVMAETDLLALVSRDSGVARFQLTSQHTADLVGLEEARVREAVVQDPLGLLVVVEL